MKLRLSSNTTGPASTAGRRSRGCGRSRPRVREALGQAFRSVEGLAVAGRTNAGVHALGNVVSVDVEGGPTGRIAPCTR